MGIAWFRKAAELAAHRASRLKLPIWGFCVLAVFMNLLLSNFSMNFLRLPLFLDTVFTAAIVFTFGLAPGMFVAILSWLLPVLYWGGFHLFVICGVAEVLLIWALKPAALVIPYFASKEWKIASYTGLAARLVILYIVCAMAISVLGGMIDYATRLFPEMDLRYFSPEDTFRPALVMADFPLIAENILVRVPVNLADRFVVVFGGYFISRGLVRLTRRK